MNIPWSIRSSYGQSLVPALSTTEDRIDQERTTIPQWTVVSPHPPRWITFIYSHIIERPTSTCCGKRNAGPGRERPRQGDVDHGRQDH